MDQDWQLSAAFWSIPVQSNEIQYSLLYDGKIHAGIPLDDQISPDAQCLAQYLIQTMVEPLTLPELYATRIDAFTIGRTIDEIFHEPDGKNWVKEIVQLPLTFAVRGGIRRAVSADGCTVWMATHIDLSSGLTVPYRLFFIWLNEKDEWKIVVSHDAVSVDPANPGFEVH